MERKFYPENFEKFLSGHADQFKMSPSKKVWHGIYNDLHPGKRWPSVAMSLIFIFSLVIIGHLNTNNGHITPLHDFTSLHKTDLKKTVKVAKNAKPADTKFVAKHNSSKNITDDPAPSNSIETTQKSSILPNSQSSDNTAGLPGKDENKYNSDVSMIKKENYSFDKIENNVITGANSGGQLKTSLQNLSDPKSGEESVTTTNDNKEIGLPDNDINVNTLPNATNIKKPRKINNVAWTYYLSPSVGYRYFSDNKINNSVIHKPMMGYETGVAMSFSIYKKLQFTTGFQLNYSGYKIKANNTHPIIASLILNSEPPGQYNVYSTMSHYGNGLGSEYSKLKNYSLQASLPIGLQYVFAANNNIKFSAAADFQPSFIIASKGHLLSTDKKNYITNPDLFRKWNMNTNFSTSVIFSSNLFNWQIGPQVRYQLLSTYSNRYPGKEHLINYGIRVGISKISN